MSFAVLINDCVEAMREMPENSVDSVVCDPPYGLEFMGKEWDRLGGDVIEDPASLGGFQDAGGGNAFTRARIRYGAGAGAQAWHEQWAREALRVLKPGGHLIAFSGTRTYHRLACAVEDAGFEIRDSLLWIYGSGFPKSLNVSKALDKAAGVLEDEAEGFTVAGRTDKNLPNPEVRGYVPPEPVTDEAKAWKGWGTALKPAHEPMVLARKPLGGTVAENVIKHGTGALNVDGCRIGTGGGTAGAGEGPPRPGGTSYNGSVDGSLNRGAGKPVEGMGRWPANVALSHSADCNGECAPDCPVAELDRQSGESVSPAGAQQYRRAETTGWPTHGIFTPDREWEAEGYDDRGGASRFFYVPKASSRERNAGLDKFAERLHGQSGGAQGALERGDEEYQGQGGIGLNRVKAVKNHHPTVKPIDLMRWLCRLVTPPGGTVLDPFLGSGTTGCAAVLEGFNFIGIERDPDYAEIADARIVFWNEYGEDAFAKLDAEEERAKIAAAGQDALF